jgi:predicted PurR-regulated permease PerM
MQDRVMPLLESVADLLDTLTKDIQSLFQSDGKVSVDQMLTKLGMNLLSKALTIVKNTLKTIITAVAKLVLLIKDVANCE